MVKILVLALAFGTVACGGDDEECQAQAASTAPICDAGKVDACACPDGTMGAQACADDGTKWGACACTDPPKPGDPGQPKVAYYAEDVCEPTSDPGYKDMCAMGAGPRSLPFINCAIPADGELVGCLLVRTEACCFPRD